MGELIRIGAKEGALGLGASIDSAGACITELSLGKDHIIFPKDLIATNLDELKFRGGIPLCSPYFGLPELMDKRGMPQHGYARDVDWDIFDHGKRYVCLRHLAGEEVPYGGLEHKLGIQVVDLAHIKILATNLKLTNIGNNKLVVSPGFHPYFSGPAEFGECNQTAKNDIRTQLKDNYSIRTVRLISGAIVKMVAVNMPNSTVWSDLPDEYHCIEPSVLPLSTEPSTEEILVPGASRQYAVSLVITPPKNPA